MSDGIVHPETRTPRMGRRERTRYVPNHKSFGAFMRSEQMREATEDVADDIALAAAAGVPPSGGGEDSEGFHDEVKSGFEVERSAGFMRIGGNMRVRVLVTNDVDGSALIEFGARGLARSRMLGRAGARFGDFKPEDGPR